jgi:hypothetical protein
MKRIMTTILIAGFVAAGAQAVADDSASTQSPTKSQAMKDCMDKQKATNSSMTPAAMKTVCHNEAKQHKDKTGNDLATGPQDSKPQN